ncbi:MAG: nitroreductase [Anaerolineae bacterium]|nr:nitroreductase [Anaerolineae bacterium]
MDFNQTVLKRRMVRHFTNEPIPKETIQHILELAQHSPSAGFTQGQDYVVVTDLETKRAIAQLCGEEHYTSAGFHPFISGAPVLIIPCTNENAYHRRYQEADKVNQEGEEINWPVPYWFMDVGCAVQIILLAVVNEGLAAGFAGAQT